jgi:branched-chain amino acid transport system permease protein
VSDQSRQPALRDRTAALRPGFAPTLLRSLAPVLGCIVIAALLQLGLRPLLNDFFAKVLLDIGTNIILAVSLTMVNGFTGQFSMGHAAFMAVGAYVAAGIVYYGSFRAFGDADLHAGALSTMLPGSDRPFITKGDLLFLASLVAGGVVAALCGYLVGLPSLRLKGDYLAIVTLGFGEIVRVLIQSQTTDTLYDPQQIAQTPLWQLPKYLGGPVGFSGLPFYASLFWAWLVAGVTLLVAFRLKRGTFGRAFLSIREDEIAAEAMGINTTRFKVRAFVIAAFFAGIAGGVYSHTVGVQLNAGELGFVKSFDIIIMVVLGGMGSITGSALAAVILTILPEALREPPSLLSLYWFWLPLLLAGLVAVFARRRLLSLGVLLGACIAWEVIRYLAIHNGVDLSKYRMVLFALGLILMMLLRPEGLLGLREVWELRLPKRGASKGARP